MRVAVSATVSSTVSSTVLSTVLSTLLAACPSTKGDATELAVWSDKEARRVGDEVVADLGRGHLEVVVARFCDQSPDGLALARELLAPAVSRADLVVRRVEPAWVQKEPYFYVELGAGELSSTTAWTHGLGVRVRDGCLERAVGARAAAAAPAPAPASTPTDASLPP